MDPEGVHRDHEARGRPHPRTRVVKYLSANFLRAFYGAGIAGKRGDFGAFMSGLVRAASIFESIMPEVAKALEELPRREKAHRFFLRNLGHGGVSAFALTEPTAGSDSGGVKTMAVLKTAMLSPLPDGRYVYSPTGELDKCKRYLIDADRVAFSADGMVYRAPDDALCPIRYDRYDYATDEGVRTYEHQGTVCEFHDIGQVRPRAPDRCSSTTALRARRCGSPREPGDPVLSLRSDAGRRHGLHGGPPRRGLKVAPTNIRPASAVRRRTRSPWTTCACRAKR